MFVRRLNFLSLFAFATSVWWGAYIEFVQETDWALYGMFYEVQLYGNKMDCEGIELKRGG